MADCEFCLIVARELTARLVFEDEETLAFFPLKPAALGHTLVIPKRHVSDLWVAEPADVIAVMNAVLTVGKAIRRALRPDGMNLIASAGEAASQTIFHLHIHLVPRWFHDHIGSIWPPGEPWSENVEDNVADLIRDSVPTS